MQAGNWDRRTAASAATVASAIVLIAGGTAGLERDALQTAWNDLRPGGGGSVLLADPPARVQDPGRVVAQLRTAVADVSIARSAAASPQTAAVRRRELAQRRAAAVALNLTSASSASSRGGASPRARREGSRSQRSRPSSGASGPVATSAAATSAASAGSASTPASAGTSSSARESVRINRGGHVKAPRIRAQRTAGGGAPTTQSVSVAQTTQQPRKVQVQRIKVQNTGRPAGGRGHSGKGAPAHAGGPPAAPAPPAAPSQGNGNNGNGHGNGHGNGGGNGNGKGNGRP